MDAADPTLTAARGGDSTAFERLVAPFRRELLAHCYRMSGSMSDAEDLLQEGMIRAWRGLAGFEGRASVRTWLYRVVTNACLDALDKRSPRALPMDLAPPADGSAVFAPRLDPIWIEPCPERFEVEPTAPDARYNARESVALAFMAALQLLPPRQRAVLVLRDVLGWDAAGCADLLGMSTAAINSALQRARETTVTRAASRDVTAPPSDEATRGLLARYVQAWELEDVQQLVSLLHEDATLSMPPISAWIRGAAAIGGSISAMLFTPRLPGRHRLVGTRANGTVAFAAYERDERGVYSARSLHVLQLDNGRIREITAFLMPQLFGAFGLAPQL